ncbi:MAG: hypothetical protein D3904_04705 [Candidatus Electrothrix sp. EH2]|nr:hypothetical protein [Candidatus Electrothrix sp. EH2]
MARTLIEEKGFTKVYALEGGWDEWYKQEDKEAYPIEKK